MARKGPKPKPLQVGEEDRAALERLVRLPTATNREVKRARIVLLSADGLGAKEIARLVDVSPATVGKWKRRYREAGYHGLTDAPRSGRPRTVTDEKVEEVVRLTLESRPKGATHWSTRQLAKRVGIGQSSVSRIWQAFRLKPHQQETFELSNDPYFVQKVRDVVGLYMAPPAHAVVFCVDEKTQIQALERTQTVLPTTPTKPRAISPKYTRHGTLDLFAALNVATGELLAETYSEHKSAQFIDFMRSIDDVVDDDLEIHVIVDNHSIHKSTETLSWMLRNPRFHLHYIPTYSSWMNMVEAVFSLLHARQLKHGVHTSVEDLENAIQEFVEAHNDNPTPFVWTKTADEILAKVARYCGKILDRHGGHN